ncbi:AI-2E family transporter [Gemmata sp.]|uniref:AI-2E family transporter n=1 Tax=Gemmata sp. TaxID=1914242 RepID=UPI003F6E5FAD
MVANGEVAARTPAPPIVQREGPLATGDRFRPVALAALTVILVGLCVWLTTPFLPAVTWGLALAILAWPLHSWVLRKVTASPNAAAAVSSLVVVLVIAVPGVFVSYQLMREAESAADRMKEQQVAGTVREVMNQRPETAAVVAWTDRVGVDLDTEARNALGALTREGAGLVQGSVMGIFQAVIALFILFYLLRDRSSLRESLRRLLPVTRPEADRVFEDAAGSVYANLYANIVTSLIDAVLGGLLFWWVGLPSPFLWGVVMFVLSLLPVLGAFMVWVPAAAYLALVGQWGGAALIVGWGVIGSALIVNTYLYPRLVGNRMRLHEVPALIAFLGGVAVFGAAGMILGPGILAVTSAVMDLWHRRSETTEAGPVTVVA